MLSRKRLRFQGSTLNARHHGAHAGFTLAELLVSMLLSSIIMGGVYSVYRMQSHTMKIQEKRLDAQDYARSVLDMMVREIRNAGNNPKGATGGANCAGGSAGAPGVVTATATTFRFTYDFQGTTAGSVPNGTCDNADEDITYAFDTTCSGGGSLGNITRNGSSNPLTDCNVVTSSFTISYFKQDGTSLTAPVTGTNLALIQRVQITLTVQSKNPDSQFGGQQLDATMTSSVDLRNRGLPS
ncbi:MAG: prepilin-type N-terminal cleavage/methylation domain-containing protein [Deltaproteobacteria bacterium]|nr:MAG: prepilin-type N-terminal cleavage/methylation domain-containing protein [Deltaproteobacteria bacterium]